jgi:PAS domain S-box-containing protein
METRMLSLSSYSFSPHAVPPLVTAFAIFFLGLFVVIREKGSRVSLLYLLYTLTVDLWLFSFSMTWFAASEQIAFLWLKVAHIGVIMIPAALYHFTAVVLRSEQQNRQRIRTAWALSTIFLAVCLLTNTLFETFNHYSWGIFVKYRWYSLPFLVYFLAMTINILRLYWVEYRKAGKHTTKQRRAKEFLIAFSIGYLGALDFLPAVGIPYYPVGSLPMFLFVILVGRAIWRYRLVDITPAFAARQIIDTMNDALIVLDPDGVVRLVNQATCALLGYREQDLVGKRPADGMTKSRVFAAEIESIIGRGTVRNREVDYRSEESGQLTLSLSTSMMRNPDGEPLATVCVLRDISERKRAEEEREVLIAQLQTANEKLKAVDQMKSEFVTVVSHELRTPLTTIKAFVELIMMKPGMTDQKRTTFLSTVNVEADRLKRMITDLLDLARIESGSITWQRDALSIKDVVGDAVTSMGPLFENKGLRVTTAFDAPHITVSGDRDRLVQVVINILSNAAKFTPSGGEIHIAVRQDPASSGQVAVQISDSGAGIPGESLDLIFEKFQRSSDRSDCAVEGTGLGLAIARQIIEFHDGRIWAASEPGKGSTFTFTLPLAGNGGRIPQ